MFDYKGSLEKIPKACPTWIKMNSLFSIKQRENGKGLNEEKIIHLAEALQH